MEIVERDTGDEECMIPETETSSNDSCLPN